MASVNPPALPAAACGDGSATSRPGHDRWVMLGLLWLLYAAFGLIQRSLAPLVTPILADLRLTYTEMGLILGSWQLTYIAAAIAAGTVIDRWGIRKSLFAGALTLGLSAALRYYANGFATMLAAVALSGIGGPMISIGCPKAIALRFAGKSRGTAIGIYLTGPWIGGIAALALTNSLVMPLTGHSWRHAFLLYAALPFAAGLAWWLLARDPGRPVREETPGILPLFRTFSRVRNIRIVLALGLLTFAILHAITSWLPRILEDGGLSPAMAGVAAAIPLCAGIPSLLILPRMVAPASRSRFLSTAAGLGLATLLPLMHGSGALQIASLILFGIVMTPVLPVLTLILMDTPEVGSRHMGSAGGLFFCVAEIGGFSGPLAVGTLVDLTGTFLSGTGFVAMLCIAILVLARLLDPPPSAAGAQASG